jgi:hypothetical protein
MNKLPHNTIELVHKKVYFLICDDRFNNSSNRNESTDEKLTYISCDDDLLVYSSFFADFGPLDLGQTIKFCNCAHDLMRRSNSGKIIFTSSSHPHKRSNAAVLVCAYLILYLGATVEQVFFVYLFIYYVHTSSILICI